MTDWVHLAAQLEAEFTLTTRSFSFSVYSSPLPLFSLSLSVHNSTPFSAVGLRVHGCNVCERGEGEANSTIMVLTSESLCCVFVQVSASL